MQEKYSVYSTSMKVWGRRGGSGNQGSIYCIRQQKICNSIDL